MIRIRILLTYFFFVFSYTVNAQNDTALTKKNFLQKALEAKDEAFLIAPIVSRTPDTRLNFSIDAIKYFKSNKKDTASTRSSHISLVADYSMNRQFKIGNSWMIYFKEDKYQSYGKVYFSNFPDVFYGVGNRTNVNDMEGFVYNKLIMFTNLLRELGNNDFYFGGSFRYNNYFDTNTENSPILSEVNTLESIENQMLGVGVQFSIDKRNSYFYNYDGLYFNVTHHYHVPMFDFIEFQNTNITFKKFFKLNKTGKDQIFAFHLQSDLNFGETIPFFELESLGGSKILRSYAANRYRDRNFVGSQIEYRFPLFWRFRGAIFTGIGEVFNRTNEVRLDYLKYSYGGGLRFVINEANMLQLRLDYGRGLGNSNAFYLGFGEAF